MALISALAGCTNADSDSDYSDVIAGRDNHIEEISEEVFENSEEFSRGDLVYAGEYKNDLIFLADVREKNIVCILVVPDDGAWVSGCGGGEEGSVSTSDPGRTYWRVADDVEPPQGATEVSRNVYVMGG